MCCESRTRMPDGCCVVPKKYEACFSRAPARCVTSRLLRLPSNPANGANAPTTNDYGVFMLGGKRLWAVLLSVCLLWFLALPAFAADPEVTAADLKGISPQRHKYLFSVLGGAAVGAGIGVLVGGSNDVTKGLMIGGGGMSALYLHTHRRDTLKGWRNWAYVGTYAAFGGGMGWTLCACDDGLIAGTLIGGGASAAWLAAHPQRTSQSASTRP